MATADSFAMLVMMEGSVTKTLSHDEKGGRATDWILPAAPSKMTTARPPPESPTTPPTQRPSPRRRAIGGGLIIPLFAAAALAFASCRPCRAFQPTTAVPSPIRSCRSRKPDRTLRLDRADPRPRSPPNAYDAVRVVRRRSSSPTTTATGPAAAVGPLAALPDLLSSLPFDEAARTLWHDLNIGSALGRNLNVNEAATGMVLESIGWDSLVFLTVTVLVTPLAKALDVTPILGYLFAGALLGPHGLDVFSNTKADVQLGDFGVLFLLFSEGLEVTRSRLSQLTKYLPLGFAQISLTSGVLTAAILSGATNFLERFLPIDAGLIDVNNPIEAFVLAAACTLSTSAFVFPVLKERGWEEEPVGEAATSVLLLQDLAVAPLLVMLPFVAGRGPADYSSIGFLTAKATLGFGSVMVAGSFVLRWLFEQVARTRSTETFVALCLLVSVGMGTIAKSLGLTDTAGAFAAGVLLANTNYRSQIQADLVPFKGILLGIFFMVAGSSFDTDLVVSEWPTVLAGVFALIFLKAATLFAATKVPEWAEPNRLGPADAIRLSILISGGGEFAFVVLAVAEKLGVLPKDLGGLLTAVVLITMALTPFKGELADSLSRPFLKEEEEAQKALDVGGRDIVMAEDVKTRIAEDAIVVFGYNEVGIRVLRSLRDEFVTPALGHRHGLPRLAAIDAAPSLENAIKMPAEGTVVLFGDASDPDVLPSYGVTTPPAIFVAYLDHAKALSAVGRLREEFGDAKIFARGQTRREALELKRAGADDVVVECDELPRSAAALLRASSERGSWTSAAAAAVEEEEGDDVRHMAAVAAGISVRDAEELLALYDGMDTDLSGRIEASEVKDRLRRSGSGIATDREIEKMEAWVDGAVPAPLDPIGFCVFYVRAPRFIKESLCETCPR